MKANMRDEFRVHLLNQDGLDKAGFIAQAFDRLLNELDELIPAGRERSLVVTKLQEANFFAKRAIAVQPENQLSVPLERAP